MKAELLEQRPGMHIIVQIPVIEGDQHRARWDGPAGQMAGEFVAGQAAVAMIAQPGKLVTEMVRRHVDGAPGRRDVVVHQHRNDCVGGHTGRASSQCL